MVIHVVYWVRERSVQTLPRFQYSRVSRAPHPIVCYKWRKPSSKQFTPPPPPSHLYTLCSTYVCVDRHVHRHRHGTPSTTWRWEWIHSHTSCNVNVPCGRWGGGPTSWSSTCRLEVMPILLVAQRTGRKVVIRWIKSNKVFERLQEYECGEYMHN